LLSQTLDVFGRNNDCLIGEHIFGARTLAEDDAFIQGHRNHVSTDAAWRDIIFETRNDDQARLGNEVEILFDSIAVIGHDLDIRRQLAGPCRRSVSGKKFAPLLQQHAGTAGASHRFDECVDIAQGAAGTEHIISLRAAPRPCVNLLPAVYFKRNIHGAIRSDAVIALAAIEVSEEQEKFINILQQQSLWESPEPADCRLWRSQDQIKGDNSQPAKGPDQLEHRRQH